MGSEHVLEVPASSPYSHDWGRRRGVESRAQLAVLPAGAGEVAAVVAWCYEHDVPIVPRGGGTGMMGGAVATHGGIVLSLERMQAIREFEPGLWRIMPEAGVKTRDLQRRARENGLMFSPDPGAAELSHIGGNVATNAGGPHALKYGVTGSWVAGLEVVLAPGELVQIGGWSGKDVAGYDLKNLLIGSEGTLGVITAVRLRLLPAPEAALAMIVFLSDVPEGCRAITRVLEAGLRPSVLDFLDGETLRMLAGSYPAGERLLGAAGSPVPEGGGFALIVEIDGSAADVAAQKGEVLELFAEQAVAVDEARDAAALWRWRDGINGVVTGIRGAKVSEDVVFPVDRLAEGLQGFAAIAAEHDLRSCAWGHGGEGNIHATVLVDPASEAELDRAEAVGERLFELVVALGGSVAGEHGVGWLKRGRLESQWAPRAVELHEAIKGIFDPKGLFNPGKKLARYSAPSPMTTSRKESSR